MTLGVYILAVSFFTLAFIFLKLNKNIALIISISRHALETINNKELPDITKENITQESAVKLFKQAAFIFSKSVIIITLTVIPFWLADTFGIVSWNESTEFSLRVDVLIYTIIIMSTAVLVRKATKPK